MILNRTTPTNLFKIWQPRWKDRTVLLATYKVGTHNSIVFTKAESMPGEYYVSGDVVTKCPIESNGTINCYCVPIDKLETLERVD